VQSNPFATRFIRPGAVLYLFAEGESASSLVERLAASGWRGQIIGPHGSGKSTLLAALVPAIEATGRRVTLVALHQGERQLPAIDLRALSPATILVIDGYEQLGWWPRWRVHRLCQRRGAGLLVTAHADCGFPTIYQTQPSAELAQRVVEALLPQGDTTLAHADVAATFEATGGNVRETLFKLFDVYQERQAIRPRR
jgi:ABC-type cobalamin/Fe3+-siderophores transport system ATPase subunit